MATPGLLFFQEGPAVVVATTTTGGTLFDHYDPNSQPFSGASTIASGVVYVGNNDGALYAFGL